MPIRRFRTRPVSVLFSEPKIPQNRKPPCCSRAVRRFSALQRAENSSNPAKIMVTIAIATVSVLFSEPKIPQKNHRVWLYVWNYRFQCSSASRKFLKMISIVNALLWYICFSALQRAENSSKLRYARRIRHLSDVSVLFSEPKIPQNLKVVLSGARKYAVSVLFSEPKIPQKRLAEGNRNPSLAFQCSSASRKFLKTPRQR